jgi:hypothetical protein
MANEFVIKNGYFSQGNSNVTGSLQVTGSVGVTGSVSITQNVTASKALFSSSNNNQLTVIGSGSTIAQVYGSQGNLLVVNDTFSGSVFTVTDISGYPILDITSDYYTSSINTIGFLNHTGSAGVTGSLIITGGFKVHEPAYGNTTLDAQGILYDTNGTASMLWPDRITIDTTDITSINWESRILNANTSDTPHIDWSNPSYINLPNTTQSPITRVLGMDSSNNVYWTSSTAFGGGGGGGGISFPYTITSSAVAPIFNVSGGIYFEIGQTGSSERLFRMKYDEVNPGVIVEMGGLSNGDTVFTVDQFLQTITINATTASILSLTDAAQTNVVTIDTSTGQLFYTASSAIGGGGSGTPGGSNKQIQFNRLGAFSGSSNFTFDSSSNTVEISGSLTVSGSGTFTNIGPAQFTGSVGVSGSLTITGSLNTTQGGFTGSLFGTASYVSGSVFTSANPALSASYALTASYIANSLITASAVSNVITFTKGDGSTFPISVTSTNTNIAAKYMGFGNNITGSTAISASYSLLIPANTFTVGDTVRVNCVYDRNAQGAASFVWYITGSTTPFSFSVVGGTQIAIVNTTTIRGLAMSRLLYISSSTNTEVVAATIGNLSSDEHGATPGNTAWGAATSSLNINWTQDQWIVFAHQNALTSNLTRVYRFMATKV